MMDYSTALTRMIFNIGAYSVNTSSPFILVARTVSPIYLDNRLFERHPHERQIAAEYLADYTDSYIGRNNIDAISGGEMADLVFSHGVANILDKPHTTIRKEDKQYGMVGAKRIMSQIMPGEKICHVADLITQAKSAIGWYDAVRDAKGLMTDYAVIFDRLQGGEQALSARGVKLHSLVKMDRRFFEIGMVDGHLTKESNGEVERYLANPARWGREYLLNNPDFIRDNIKVENGRIVNRKGLEVLTTGYPQLIPEFEERVRLWLGELGLKEAVTEFGYQP